MGITAWWAKENNVFYSLLAQMCGVAGSRGKEKYRSDQIYLFKGSCHQLCEGLVWIHKCPWGGGDNFQFYIDRSFLDLLVMMLGVGVGFGKLDSIPKLCAIIRYTVKYLLSRETREHPNIDL